MEHSQECKEIFEAFSKAQSEIAQPTLDGSANIGGKFSFKYATLGEVQKCIKQANAKYGLAITQDDVVIDSHLYLMTLIIHSSGQWIKYISPYVGNYKADCKQFGATKTCLRRYALYGIYNLYGQEDGDIKALESTPEETQKNIGDA